MNELEKNAEQQEVEFINCSIHDTAAELTALRARVAELEAALTKISGVEFDVNLQPAAYLMREHARSVLAKK